jgi:hypothetical protein
MYLLLDVTYVGVSGPDASYGPFEWTVVDTAGGRFDSADGIAAECQPVLSTGDGLHGNRRGTVAFQVPKSFRHGLAIYTPLDGHTTASWKL